MKLPRQWAMSLPSYDSKPCSTCGWWLMWTSAPRSSDRRRSSRSPGVGSLRNLKSGASGTATLDSTGGGASRKRPSGGGAGWYSSPLWVWTMTRSLCSRQPSMAFCRLSGSR